MKIDAHQHYWQIARGDYGWLTPALAPIYRDFNPPDLEPHLAACGIEKTIVVQAAPTEAETAFLLDLATRTPSIAGVVGWIDFDADDAAARIAAVHGPLLCGVRPMMQDLADDDWMLRTSLVPAFQAMAQRDLVFDALVKPRHLSRLDRLAAQHPTLSIVIDHAAKPDIASGDLTAWKRDMTTLAQRPNVVVKLSGLATEAAVGWQPNDLAPVADHLLATFGPQRIIWGSDWPVLNRNGDYIRWWAATETLLSSLDSNERDAILGGNAARIYLNNERRPAC